MGQKSKNGQMLCFFTTQYLYKMYQIFSLPYLYTKLCHSFSCERVLRVHCGGVTKCAAGQFMMKCWDDQGETILQDISTCKVSYAIPMKHLVIPRQDLNKCNIQQIQVPVFSSGSFCSTTVFHWDGLNSLSGDIQRHNNVHSTPHTLISHGLNKK